MNTKLSDAASKNDIEKAKEVYCENDFLFDPLGMAAQDGHIEMIRFLLTLKTTTEDLQSGLSEALFLSSQNGHIDIVELLLSNGASIYRKGIGNSRTALHAAAGQGHVEIVKKIVDSGIENVDILTEDNVTPIAEAVNANHIDTVKILLEYGSEPIIEDNFGRSAFNIAYHYGTDEMKKLLEII